MNCDCPFAADFLPDTPPLRLRTSGPASTPLVQTATQPKGAMPGWEQQDAIRFVTGESNPLPYVRITLSARGEAQSS